MRIMQDHGHRGMLPTGYRTRDIKVQKGVNVVRVPEPTYDENDVVAPCPYCYNAGVDDERDVADALMEAIRPMLEDDWFYIGTYEDDLRKAVVAYEEARA